MKKMTFSKIIGLLLVCLMLGELAYSLSETEFSSQQTGETIQLVHNPWDTEVASANVVALALEEAGYQVKLVSVDNAIMYESVASGESDAMTAAWLPTTHGSIYESYEDQMENLGPNLEGAKSGLVVPSYMAVDSIDQLSQEAGKNIVGIEPGAGIMVQTELAMEAYDNFSDWTLESPSTGAMLALLKDALANEEEIVITGWTPHWKFQRYDLKFLEDPLNIYGESEQIHTLVRHGLKDDFPVAYQILDNFHWDVEDMESVTLAMENGVNEKQAAQDWLAENPEKLQSWLSDLPS